MPHMTQSLFQSVGGLPTLEKVHKIFYDHVYAHDWLKSFFEGHNQQFIEDRQTAFMGQKMGGDVAYKGRTLDSAHRYMYIPPELFEVRREILRQSLQEAGVSETHIEQWLQIDGAFFKQIVDDSMGDFYANSWKYQKRVIVPRP